MKKLLELERLLPYISDYDFYNAQENLMKNMTQKSFYREKQFIVFDKETISDNFTNDNLRRSYYSKCELNEVNLTNVGMSGSVFIDTKFNDCILHNTKLDFCEFDECIWKNSSENEMVYTNFNRSMILNSQFIDAILNAINFTDVIFEGTIFDNCEWKSLCLEGAVFKNTTLNNVKLTKLNLEFARFDNIKLNNVRLPFPTIPYVFNGLKYLMNTTDEVYISSADTPERRISKEKYLSYLNDLTTFYTKTQNYFPLANILIAREKFDEAYAAIILGIRFSMVHIRNFRLVYYYCKLLQLTKEFSMNQLSYAYDIIIKNSNVSTWRKQDCYNFSYYIDSIRNILLNENDGSFLTMTLYTNILCNEFSKIAELYRVIESAIHSIKQQYHRRINHYVEVRHNSPHEFFIKIFSDPEMLNVILEILQMIFMGVGYVLTLNEKKENEKKEKKREKREKKLSDLEYELKKAQLDYYKEKTEYLEQQNKRLYEQTNALQQVLAQNKVVIKNINYHIFDNEL